MIFSLTVHYLWFGFLKQDDNIRTCLTHLFIFVFFFFFPKCHYKSALGLQADLRLLVKGHIALTGEGLHLNYTDVMRPGCAYKVAPAKNTRGSTASRDCGSAYGLARPASGPGWADGIWQLYTLLVMLVAVITCSHAGRECHVACSQGSEDYQGEIACTCLDQRRCVLVRFVQ